MQKNDKIDLLLLLLNDEIKKHEKELKQNNNNKNARINYIKALTDLKIDLLFERAKK